MGETEGFSREGNQHLPPLATGIDGAGPPPSVAKRYCTKGCPLWSKGSRSGSSSTRRKKTKLVLKIQSEMKSSLSVVSNSLQLHGLQPHQAPLSMEFSRQEYWSELPFPSPKGAIKLPHCLLSPELTNSLNSLNHEQSPKTTDKVYSLI